MSSTDSPTQASGARRPSLITPKKHGSAEAAPLRMLDGLGVAQVPEVRSSLRGRVGWAVALLVAGGFLGHAWWQPVLQSIPSLPSLASQTQGADQAALSGASTVARAAASASAALIERAPMFPPPAPPDDVAPPAAPSGVASAAVSATRVARMPEQPTVPAARRVKDPPAQPAPRRPSQQVAGGRDAPAPASAARATGSPDPDVDLVAALMAHVAAPARPADANAGGPGMPALRAQATPPGAPVRGTLDQRVQRCKARHPNDLEASRACRRRVCDGQWGRHAACPTRLMPRPATTVQSPPARATPA